MPHVAGARLTVELPQPPAAAFAQVVDELVETLERAGLEFATGPRGSVTDLGAPVARVTAWSPGREFALRWNSTPWGAETPVDFAARFDATPDGSRLTVTVDGAPRLVNEDPTEWTGWVVTALGGPVARALTPRGFGDWLTDRRARRPSGPSARSIYGDPVFHRPNFRLLLDTLHPGPSDRVLEVGCGGGALLAEMLARGARAVGLDHSPEMVRLARSANAAAVGDGRLTVKVADAGRLPVPDAAFTLAVSTGVFGFLPEPGATLREMHRALAPGGRLAVFAGTAELRGTPACPEPMASRIHFFEDEELARLAEAAGFVDVAVTHPSLYEYAIASGVPKDALGLFEGTGGSQLLTARRAGPRTQPTRPARGRPSRKATPGGRARRG